MRRTRLLAALVVAGLAGCAGDGYVLEREVDLDKVNVPPRLDVPPGMRGDRLGELMPIPDDELAAATARLIASGTPPEGPKPLRTAIEVRRAGELRWLAVPAKVEALWPLATAFWRSQGYALAREDTRLGVLVTEWKDGRALAAGAPLRDQYRMRLERTAKGDTTEVYLAHRGVGEVRHEGKAAWQVRPAERELEIEMLLRFMRYLSTVSPDEAALQADVPPWARLVDVGNESELEIDRELPVAWRQLGVALDRLGAYIVDRSEARGIYLIRLLDPAAAPTAEVQDGTQYRIKLRAAGDGRTRVALRSGEDFALAPETARPLLGQLQAALFGDLGRVGRAR